MSRPVSVLFRRVADNLAATSRDLVPTTAAMGADVSSPEDVLRFALEVGLVVLGCAAPPSPDAAARRYIDAALDARARHPELAPLREE